MGATRHDLIVIGSGPAGEKGAAQAAYFGKSVALVEREPFLGGAAANTGTLPSKTLRETALMLSGFRARGHEGVDLSVKSEVSVRDFLARERAVKGSERRRIGANLERHGVSVHRGRASFVEPHVVRVSPDEGEAVDLEGDFVLLATGSRPLRPDTFPWGESCVLDSDTILEIERMPKRLLIVGGGVIGCEYACTFAALGVEVTLVDGRDTILGFLDEDLSEALGRRMRELGVRMLTPERVGACRVEGGSVTLELESGERVDGDAVLVAAGRCSNVDGLALEVPGVEVGRRGLVEVDERYRTSAAHVYAAGDVIGFPALASTSMEQARRAMVDAFDLEYKKDVAPVLPFGIYTIPEVSMVGETSASLREKGIDFVAGRASYADNPRGQIIGDVGEAAGFLKLLFRRDDMTLLGVHCIGESATELVHVGAMALLTGAKAELFIRACFNYPTLGDLYKYATYDAMGRQQRGE